MKKGKGEKEEKSIGEETKDKIEKIVKIMKEKKWKTVCTACVKNYSALSGEINACEMPSEVLFAVHAPG